MKNIVTDTNQLLVRARTMRVETAALLTAIRVVFGKTTSSIEHPSISEEWMPQYHRQVQEKLRILQPNRTSRNNC